ncbi:MAG: hypothetical protein IJK02_06940 [Clostridia bacterium]|nr:hypothetical protein [Clostridia bacterium]MBR0537088.1 hypothetical protein [Clostridia bacterium]
MPIVFHSPLICRAKKGRSTLIVRYNQKKSNSFTKNTYPNVKSADKRRKSLLLTGGKAYNQKDKEEKARKRLQVKDLKKGAIRA